MPGYHAGARRETKASNTGGPPTVEEIVAVMRTVGDRADGRRLRALIVLLWRAGLRISEALALHEGDLDRARGAVLVRRGKGGKRREVGMDRWAWAQLDPWLEIRRGLPAGSLMCVIHGPTAGRHWKRRQLASNCTTRPQQLASVGDSPRISCGTPMRSKWRTKVSASCDPAPTRPREPRHHQRLLQGIDSAEIIDTVHGRPSPMISASAGMRSRDKRPRHRVGRGGGRPLLSLPHLRLARRRALAAWRRGPALISGGPNPGLRVCGLS